MSEEKPVKTAYLRVLWVALILLFLVLVACILKCDMAPPAY